MGLLEGWTSGTQLGLAAQEAKLKAALWDSQAKHYDAQTQLAQHEMQKQQVMQGLVQQQQIQGGLGDYLKTNPDMQGMQQALGQGRLQDYFVNNPQAMDTQAQRLQPIMDATAGGGGVGTLSPAQRQDMLKWLPPKPLDMMTLAGLAGNSGLFKESAQLQQAALEHQKVQLQLRTEGLQNQAAQLMQEIQAIPANDPQQAGKLQLKQLQLAGLMTQMGKTGDALKLLQPDTKAVDVTQRLVQTPGMIGQQPQVILPAVKTKAEQEAEMEDARRFVQTHSPGTPYPGPGATASQPAAASTPQATGPTGALQSYVVQEATKRKIPAAYALTLFDTESGFDNAAVNPTTGAFSVAQFLPTTAQDRKLDAAKLTADPKYAIDEGLTYFAELLKANGGDLDKTMLQYKGATSPEAQRAELGKFYQKYPAYAHQVLGGQATPQKPGTGESYTEIQERQRQQTLQNVQSGLPNATAGDVETVKKRAERRATQIPREAAEAIGVPLSTTYGDIEDGKVKPESKSTVPKQLPTGKEREDLADYDKVLTLSQGLVEQLQKNPKAAELLGGWFVDPAAAWKRLRARQGAAASPEGRAFLAEYGLAAAQLRTTLIGLAQTNQEMGSLLDAIPKPEAGADNIIAGLQAVIKTTTIQRDTKLKGQQSIGVKTPTGSPAPGAPGATAQPQGKSAVEDALRKQGLIK